MARQYRVGISGSYGGLNLGDEAILTCIVGQLRESLPVEITVFTRNAEDTRRRHAVERAVPVRELTRAEARAEVERLDLFILGGGGILFDEEAQIYLREVCLAHEVGVPVAVYAVSVGPLRTAEARELVRDALDRAALITVRDRHGRRLLEEVGVAREIHETADPALLLRPEPVPPASLAAGRFGSGRPHIGLSVREPGPAAPHMDVDHYHRLLANAADFVVDRIDADILFVPMERQNEDIQHSHAVIARMQHAARASVVKGEYTPGQLLDLVGRLDFAIGMRLHFLIFAALQGVPFVGLPYSAKVEGLLEGLGLPMPPLEAVHTGGLLATIDRSWDFRADLRARIRHHLPSLQARALETHRLVTRLLVGHDLTDPQETIENAIIAPPGDAPDPPASAP